LPWQPHMRGPGVGTKITALVPASTRKIAAYLQVPMPVNRSLNCITAWASDRERVATPRNPKRIAGRSEALAASARNEIRPDADSGCPRDVDCCTVD